jgi:mevalonate kinase
MKVAAPGKIILSGEHAVVYGKPAIALAVNRYVWTEISAKSRPGILFEFAELKHRSHVSDRVLSVLKQRIKNKYQRFIRGQFNIAQVLKKPFELAQFAFGTISETLNLSLPHGIKIHISSDIPIGSGMGSSAATIVSVMFAIAQYMQKPLLEDELFKAALSAENMQHGFSSGLDLRVALHGGCLYMHGGLIQQTKLPNWPIYLIYTGAPASTTGQCVSAVAAKLRAGSLANEIAAVTERLHAALMAQDQQAFRQAVTDNHQLLVQLGVVPAKIASFIAELARHDAVAKICGAGAISGDTAGIILVVTQDITTIQPLCKQAGYTLLAVEPTERGVHVV